MFMQYGRQGLKSNPKKVESAYEAQAKDHRKKIGELVLQIDALKEATEVLSQEENSSS